MSDQKFKYLAIAADGQMTAFKTSPIYYESSDMFTGEYNDSGDLVGYRKGTYEPTVYLLDEKYSEKIESYLNDVDNGLSLLLAGIMASHPVEYEYHDKPDYEDDFNEF